MLTFLLIYLPSIELYQIQFYLTKQPTKTVMSKNPIPAKPTYSNLVNSVLLFFEFFIKINKN